LSDDILVDIEDLHFNYDGRPVLEGINMKIPRGKVVAIMGGSGCGKTTLLRCIGGQLTALYRRSAEADRRARPARQAPRVRDVA